MTSGQVEQAQRPGDTATRLDTACQMQGKPVTGQPMSEQPTFQSKSSPAIPIWIALIVLVMSALCIQMRSEVTSYNFLIEGGPAADGAAVSIDGKPIGTMSDLAGNGVKLIGLRTHLVDGTHNIEVIKPGYLPCRKQVILKGEEYLGLQLEKAGP